MYNAADRLKVNFEREIIIPAILINVRGLFIDRTAVCAREKPEKRKKKKRGEKENPGEARKLLRFEPLSSPRSPVPHCLTRALINERARDTEHGR